MRYRDASFGVLLLLLQTSIIILGLQEVHERWVAFGYDFHLIAALPLMLKHFRLHQLFGMLLLAAAIHNCAVAPAALHSQTLEERKALWRRRGRD